MTRGVLLTLLACTGCIGAPNPLAPTLRGSIGMPHQGVQTGAVELPVRGTGYVRFRPKSPNYWGNPRLVSAVERAAAAVHHALPEGPPLVVGDLSARHGGKIPGHNSHRTGRDVDLLWYVTTPAGAPIRNPGFIRVESDGLAKVLDTGDYVRLDLERQWLLIRELILDDHALVQWMFMSRELEALVVDYARARGEDLELVWRAETVMLQPGDSAPHDDHIHLRIACTPEEAVVGCAGGGPYWEWLPALPRLDDPDGILLDTIAREDPVDSSEVVQTTAAAHDDDA